MASGLHIQIQGLKELMDKIDKKKNQLNKEIDREFRTTAQEIVADAKSRVPVDTGALKNSIYFLKQGQAFYEIKATAKYAAYVEFGTGTRVRIPKSPVGIGQYAATFKGRNIRQVNNRAQPYLVINLMKHSRLMLKRIKTILGKW